MFIFFIRALQSCDIGTFVRVSGQYPELAVHEKILDNYIALLSKDMVRTEFSICCYSYFNTLLTAVLD